MRGRPMTPAVESEIANKATMILHPDGADERVLEWDHDGAIAPDGEER